MNYLPGQTLYVSDRTKACHLTVEETIVGHATGLAALASALSAERRATTAETIDHFHRHGILHGRDLGYGNRTVSAQVCGLFLALCSFAIVFDRERLTKLALVAPKPKPSISLWQSLLDLSKVGDPSTFYLKFPTPMIGNSKKLQEPLADPASP